MPKISISQMARQGIAVCTSPALSRDSKYRVILYDAKLLSKLIERHKELEAAERKHSYKRGAESFKVSALIYGELEADDIEHIKADGELFSYAEICRSKARDGYGPVMYEIMMATCGRPLSPDCMLSGRAKAVWRKFHERPDVENVQRIRAGRYWSGPEAYHFCYRLRRKLRFEGLKKNHEKVLKLAGNARRQKQFVLKTLYSSTEAFYE